MADRAFLAKSFHDRAFYRISSDASIDNPDQRVSEDLQTFANFTVSFVMQVLQGLVTAAAFLVVLWLISPMLVGVLAICVSLGSLLTIVIGRPLIGINFAQRRREADFRYGLVGLRDNAEAIALYGGERREQGELLECLYAAIKNFNLLISWQRNLAFFTYSYDFLLPLLPYFILAPSFFAGKIEFSKITQASGAFITLRTSLSIIIDQFNSLSSFAAVVERLGGYLEVAESGQLAQAAAEVVSAKAIGADVEPQIETVEAPGFAVEHLTLNSGQSQNPGARDVIRNCSRRGSVDCR